MRVPDCLRGSNILTKPREKCFYPRYPPWERNLMSIHVVPLSCPAQAYTGNWLPYVALEGKLNKNIIFLVWSAIWKEKVEKVFCLNVSIFICVDHF